MLIEFLKENYANLFSLFNIIVLIITLGILLCYASDTKLIAEQAKESNLRPVVLRSGFVVDWNDVRSRTAEYIPKEKIEKLISQENKKSNVEGTEKIDQSQPLQFTILKNIAVDISGFVIVDGYKYTLVFGNKISQKEYGEQLSTVSLLPNWGWMKADTQIFAFLEPKSKVKSNEDNQIFINYKDIEGNSYYTKEDRYFSQKSFPLRNK